MKKGTIVEIGGVDFEYSGYAEGYAYMAKYNDEKQIFSSYGKPSYAKIGIWKEWCEWARNNHARLYIYSRNCNLFTIRGDVLTDDGLKTVWITKSHNRIYDTNE